MRLPETSAIRSQRQLVAGERTSPPRSPASASGCFMSPLGGLASPVGRAVLVLSGARSSSLLVSLGMPFGEGRGLRQHFGRPVIRLGQPLGYLPSICDVAFQGSVRIHNHAWPRLHYLAGRTIAIQRIPLARLGNPRGAWVLGCNMCSRLFARDDGSRIASHG